MHTVNLTIDQMALAAHEGCRRQIAGLARGGQHKVFTPQNPFDTDIQGAAAELAVTLACRGVWEGREGIGAADVRHPSGDAVSVRWTDNPNGGLIIRPDDADGWYLLVTGRMPKMTVVGWYPKQGTPLDLYKYDANGKPPCWIIPASTLQPFEPFWIIPPSNLGPFEPTLE